MPGCATVLPLDDIVMCARTTTKDGWPLPEPTGDVSRRRSPARPRFVGPAWAWATGGGTQPARRAGVRAIFVECHYDEPAAVGADLVVGEACSRPCRGFAASSATMGEVHERRTGLRRVKIFADGADLAGMLEATAVPYPRLHDESDADAQGRSQRLPRVRPEDARRDSRSADLVRGVRRTTSTRWNDRRGDRDLGRERLRQDPGDEHPAESARPIDPPLAATQGVSSTSPRCSHVRRSRAHPGALPRPRTPAYVSVFAGRIADTGRDPVPIWRRPSTLVPRSRRRADLGEPARAPQRVPGR